MPKVLAVLLLASQWHCIHPHQEQDAIQRWHVSDGIALALALAQEHAMREWIKPILSRASTVSWEQILSSYISLFPNRGAGELVQYLQGLGCEELTHVDWTRVQVTEPTLI